MLHTKQNVGEILEKIRGIDHHSFILGDASIDHLHGIVKVIGPIEERRQLGQLLELHRVIHGLLVAAILHRDGDIGQFLFEINDRLHLYASIGLIGPKQYTDLGHIFNILAEHLAVYIGLVVIVIGRGQCETTLIDLYNMTRGVLVVFPNGPAKEAVEIVSEIGDIYRLIPDIP